MKWLARLRMVQVPCSNHCHYTGYNIHASFSSVSRRRPSDNSDTSRFTRILFRRFFVCFFFFCNYAVLILSSLFIRTIHPELRDLIKKGKHITIKPPTSTVGITKTKQQTINVAETSPLEPQSSWPPGSQDPDALLPPLVNPITPIP